MTARSGVAVWSKTAATNNTIDEAVNYAEGQAPSSVNDSARAAMASTAKWRDDNSGSLATTGTSTAYVLTTNQNYAAKDSSFVADYTVAFQIDGDCGTPVTLNVDGLGAKPLRSAAGVELLAGALKAGAIYSATYKTSNSGEWILQNATTVLADGQVATAKIADGAVTYAKLQDVSATSRILGRKTASAGDVEECALTDVLDMIGSAARGDILVRGASAWARVALGGQGAVLRSDGTDTAMGPIPLLHLRDQVASAAAPQSLTNSTWNTRRLQTTVTNEITGASIASNQLTLPAGTFEVSGFAKVSSAVTTSYDLLSQLRLRNITGAATLLVGMSHANAGFVNPGQGSASSETLAAINGRFTLGGSSVVELQNYVFGNAGSVTGGRAGSTGEVEVYTDLLIRRVA